MSYLPAPSKDHVKRGLARFLQQYKNKPNLAALLSSYLRRVQELEDAAWEVILYRLLDNAEGIQLDRLGAIVGRGRGSLADPEYLLAIRAQIRINRSCGSPEDMIAVAGLTLPAGDAFSYGEAYPATIVIQVLSPETDTVIGVLFDCLIRTKPGGVRLLLEYSGVILGHTFTLSPYSSPVASTLLGFADYYNPGAGGYFAGVLSSP